MGSQVWWPVRIVLCVVTYTPLFANDKNEYELGRHMAMAFLARLRDELFWGTVRCTAGLYILDVVKSHHTGMLIQLYSPLMGLSLCA